MSLPELGDALLRVAFFSSLFLGVAHVATLLLRKQSAALRHLAWSAALLAAVLVPVTTLIPARLAWLPPAADEFTTSTQLAVAPRADAGAESLAPQALAPATALPTGDPTVSAAPARPASKAPALTEQAPTRVPWQSIGASLWALGAAVLLIRLAMTARGARRSLQGAMGASDAQVSRFRVLAERMGAPKATKLMVSDALGGPRTTGVLSSVVIAPADDEWHGSAEGEVALLHELGHAKRRDVRTQFIGLIASALYWWNPLVWSAAKNQRVEAELACDDEVLLTGTNPEDYAACLLSAARSFKGSRNALQIAMASPHGLQHRIDASLDDGRHRAPFSSGARICAWSTVTLLAVCGGTLARSVEPQAPTPAEQKPVVTHAVPSQNGTPETSQLDQLRKELAEDPGNPMITKKLASALARKGENEEALELMLWCFDHGDEPPHQSFSGVRVSFLLVDLDRLAETYPPARVAMISRRDSAKKNVLSESPTRRATGNFIDLNARLGDAAMTLAAYHQLVKNCDEADSGSKRHLLKAREQLFKEVVPMLIEAMRYDDVVEGFGDPIDWMKRQVWLTELMKRPGSQPIPGVPSAHEIHVEHTVKEAGYLYTALLGAGGDDLVVTEFVAQLIDYAPARGTWKTLLESAKKVGRDDIEKSLVADAKKALSEEEFARLDFNHK